MIRITDYIASAGGWLRIDQFMQIALYLPQDGYYSASIQNIGARGDFSTSATISPLLGKAIMGEWKKACARFRKKLPIIEIGAGNASLAMSFMESLGFWERLSVKYHIVETSAPLRNLQHLALGKKAKIHKSMASALKSCGGTAFIFSNELVDAFPARVFEYTASGWMELGVSVQNGEIAETLSPPASLPKSTALEHETDQGQRVEVHESYREWFLEWLPLWKKGIMTTIDYGDTLEKVYLRKPKGTLRAYRNHQMFTGVDVYKNAGKSDITCDVNFSDLQLILEQCVGDKVTLLSQRDYLLPWAGDSKTDKDLYILREDGPGDHFKVLIQERS